MIIQKEIVQLICTSVFGDYISSFSTLYLQVVTVVGVVLNGANVVGYVKCRRDAGTKLTSMAGQLLGQQILKQVTTRLEYCCYRKFISYLVLLGLSPSSRDQMITQHINNSIQ